MKWNGWQVKLNGWCEGGLGQQREVGGGCGTIAKNKMKWRATVDMQMLEFTLIFLLVPVFFRTALQRSGGL